MTFTVSVSETEATTEMVVDWLPELCAKARPKHKNVINKKLKDIGFQVENPFYFGKFRKEYKKLTAELDKLDEETLTNNDVTSIKLSFENVIERLRNLEYEIADERRSGLYNFVWKSFYFGMPVLIGLYQLIAMQYLTLNPYLPIGVYIIIVFVIYLLPKSITNLKYLYISLKTDSSNRYFLILMLLAPLVLILVSWFKPEPRDTQVIIPLSIISLISIYFFARSAVRDSKEALVREEIESLAEKYNLETKDASE